MHSSPLKHRKLNDIEQAFAIANEAFPMCVVCVLHLQNIEDSKRLSTAMHQLQQRHWLLRSAIKKTDRQYFFEEQDPPPPIAITSFVADHENEWRHHAETLINAKFAPNEALIKHLIVQYPSSGKISWLISFHHSIIDGVYARLLLHELLCLTGGIALPATTKNEIIIDSSSFSKRSSSVSGFLMNEFKNEWSYYRTGYASKIPLHAHNATINLNLNAATTARLARNASKNNVSLNSLLLAAFTCSAVAVRHAHHRKKLARVISFADMRQSSMNQVADEYQGSLVSMLRLNVEIDQPPNIIAIAKRIHGALLKSGFKGEPAIMFSLSKSVMKLSITMRLSRLGLAAISFLGKLDLEEKYGEVGLEHVAAFITNNNLGPEFSAFAKILFGKLSIDFTYLSAETSKEQATQMVAHTRELLETVVGND